jgi:hypothetical protein
MNARILAGGLVGGVVLFLWGSLAHVVLPLGEIGFQPLPNEEPVVEAMRTHIPAPGLYFIPGIAPGQHGDEAAMKAWDEKAKRGPVALLVYQLRGSGAMEPAQLGIEFVSNLLIGLLAGIVLANLGGSFLLRTGLVGVMGLMSSLDILVSEWNWYKYPTDYTMAQMAIQVVGFLLMGAAAAAVIKKG